MNISHILEDLGENRGEFIEALSDASHYLWTAIDLLDRQDQVDLRALLGARDAIDEVLGACESDNALNKALFLKAPTLADLKDGILLMHFKSQKLYQFKGFEKSWITTIDLESGETFKFLGYSLIDYRIADNDIDPTINWQPNSCGGGTNV